MSDVFNLHELDVDGAIEESASKVDEHTRSAFLRKAGIGLGALAGGSALIGATAGPRVGQGEQATSTS